MTYASGEAVKLPHGYHVKAALMGIGHEPIQLGPAVFRAGDSRIDIFAGDRQATAFAVFTQFAKLHLRGLPVVCCADSGVQGRAGYAVVSQVAPPVCNWVRSRSVLVAPGGFAS